MSKTDIRYSQNSGRPCHCRAYSRTANQSAGNHDSSAFWRQTASRIIATGGPPRGNYSTPCLHDSLWSYRPAVTSQQPIQASKHSAERAFSAERASTPHHPNTPQPCSPYACSTMDTGISTGIIQEPRPQAYDAIDLAETYKVGSIIPRPELDVVTKRT